MCGICGFFTRGSIKEGNLEAMNNTMRHRGPDDAGLELYPISGGYTVGLAQRRLAIQDLSPLGHQPMTSADGRLSVVFNGEIYHFQELREELSDYPFRSRCDTEVILAAYLRWGDAFVEHIHGMFAIALYDREQETLYLARDRIGKKPLYYWMEDGNLVFASELKPILACPGFDARIRRDLIPRYLYQQYYNAPNTVFEDVYQLKPGHLLAFHCGETRESCYWSVCGAYEQAQQSLITDYDSAKTVLKNQLRQAVARRMIADVPLGCFLSGGYDSSLISAMAQEVSHDPIRTFSIGFEDPAYNEAEYARQVAAHLGTRHTETIITEADMLALVDSIADYYDEPFADSSQIPTMLVCETARKDVTVALSGDGGDEFFCGYNIYDNVAQAQQLDLVGGITWGVGQLPFPGGHLMDILPFRVQVVAENRDPRTKVQFASESYILAAHAFLSGQEMGDADAVADIPCKYPVEKVYAEVIRRTGARHQGRGAAWQIRRMLLDMDTYLPGDILVKMDRASMKYSLECRCPIMDTGVMETSFRIPHGFKYRKGDKKHILKDIAYDYIPSSLLDRPKKGFGVPLDAWLRGPLREALTDYCESSWLSRQGIFDVPYVTDFIARYLQRGDAGPASGANYSKLTWSFFVFQQWYERHILQRGRQ